MVASATGFSFMIALLPVAMYQAHARDVVGKGGWRRGR
jgi:hypothetical protein